MSFDFVSGDTGTVLNITCKDKVTKVAIDLTGATVSLRWVNAGGLVTTVVMTIVSAIAGTVKYQFLAGQLFAPEMKFEVEVVDGLGAKVTSVDTINVAVRQEIA